MGYTTVFESNFESKLDTGTLKALEKYSSRKTYPAGTMLCCQGVVEHAFYMIVEGLVSVVQKIKGAEDRILGLLGPGEFFGEMGLISDRPRMANCRALKEVVVLEINQADFDSVVSQSPKLAFSLLKKITDTVKQLDEIAVMEILQKNVELTEAYDKLKAAHADIVEKERMEKELQLAADVQRSLLPDNFIDLPGYGFAAYLKPAKRVGGDFYDVIPVDARHVGLLIADVSDKDIPAAMFMAVTRTLFYTESRHSLSPANVALNVHRGMMGIAPKINAFVTAFYGVLDVKTRRVQYVCAGHERPLIYRKGKRAGFLSAEGRFLGMMDGLELDEYVYQMQPGDRMVLYSDGVTDATDSNDERFGRKRFAHSLEQCGDQSADAIVKHILRDVSKFCGRAPQFDDLAILVVEIN